jgi:hypothetical protein
MDVIDLRRERPATPLTGGARFIRGFTRVGAVVAVLVVLIGGAITVTVSVHAYASSARGYESAQCIARLARGGFVFKRRYEFSDTLNYEVGGCSDTGIYGKPVSQVIAIADAPKPTFVASDGVTSLGIGLIITGLCAIAAYAAFWVIGWVFAGFTRDA